MLTVHVVRHPLACISGAEDVVMLHCQVEVHTPTSTSWCPQGVISYSRQVVVPVRIFVEHLVVETYLDGLPHSPLKPLWFHRQDPNIV